MALFLYFLLTIAIRIVLRVKRSKELIPKIKQIGRAKTFYIRCLLFSIVLSKVIALPTIDIAIVIALKGVAKSNKQIKLRVITIERAI